MTTLVMGCSSALNNTITKISSILLSYLKSIGSSIQMSRQIEANRYLARHLLQEYPEHTYESLLCELNYKTIQGGTK